MSKGEKRSGPVADSAVGAPIVCSRIMCCLKQTIYSTARRVDEAPRAYNPTAPPPEFVVQSYMFAH